MQYKTVWYQSGFKPCPVFEITVNIPITSETFLLYTETVGCFLFAGRTNPKQDIYWWWYWWTLQWKLIRAITVSLWLSSFQTDKNFCFSPDIYLFHSYGNINDAAHHPESTNSSDQQQIFTCVFVCVRGEDGEPSRTIMTANQDSAYTLKCFLETRLLLGPLSTAFLGSSKSPL